MFGCDIFHMARQKKLPFNISSSNAHNPFDLIRMDIRGPFSTTSIHGYQYSFIVLDDNSTYVKNFIQMVDTQFDNQTKVIQTYNGPKGVETPNQLCRNSTIE
ncbi:hypothetical protein CR513_08131, partial [Mucuna pruriens]